MPSDEKTPQNRLVVASKSWGEELPEWLLEEIGKERMMLGLLHLSDPEETVGEAEVLAYLFTAGLTGPMPPELIAVYQYVAAVVLKRLDLPLLEPMARRLEAGLTPKESQALERLKRKLYHDRGGEIEHPVLNVLRENHKAANANDSSTHGRPGNQNASEPARDDQEPSPKGQPPAS